MPPKKKLNEPSKKTDLKKKEKIIEDKTFGLKNKKGAKNQKFIQQVHNQVKAPGPKKVGEVDKNKVKEDKKKEADELNQLFKPVVTQKIEKGADPKSVLCAFFKQGHCSKGDKCKFSHDPTVERKAEKKSVYVDMRDEDTMENWDEEKLKEVIEKKHGEAERTVPKTTIICKYFLDALESNKYGWFWECPKGGTKCHYRHALPPDFVLNKDKKKADKKEETSIEEHVEHQRAQLGVHLTKVTLETFLAWKKKKLKEKQLRESNEQDRKKAEFKAGRSLGLSGRDMFTFRPEMAADDMMEEGEATLDILRGEEDEEEEEEDDTTFKQLSSGVREIRTEDLLAAASEVDGTGTVVEQRHWELHNNINGVEDGEEAAAGGCEDVPIDENLFDDDDLDDLEDDLDDLDLEQ